MSCKKCNSVKTVTLRKSDFYCDNCFLTNTNHKFRACLGKNKALSPYENVLICISGGLGSTVLLDLLSYSLSLDNNKKLRIVPLLLHLFDNTSRDEAEVILKQCKKYNFDVYIIHISDYINDNSKMPLVNNIPTTQTDDVNKFNTIIDNMLPTMTNDFLLKVKRHLFIKYANELNCKTIFTAETTFSLANNLLCHLALGRGSQIQNNIGFSDTRNETVKILRPMKDISNEELDYYIKIRQLNPICKDDIPKNSLQSVINNFVIDLQQNFQSTISTICKTADKIGDHDEISSGSNKCIICESAMNTKALKLSALEATNVSQVISYGNSCLNQKNNIDINKLREYKDQYEKFPWVNTHLCYGCSRNYSEMKQPILPPHVLRLLMKT